MSTSTPVFPYPGSKANLAGAFVGRMPSHESYVEPFAGTLAVLLAKKPAAYEVVNDRDEEIVNFYRVLRDHPDALYSICDMTPWSRTEFEDCRNFRHCHATSDPIERAREFWYCRAYSVNGKGESFAAAEGKGQNARTYLERMHAVAERMKGVLVENMDFEEMFDKYGGPGTLFYCDPPYLGSTRSSHIYNFEMTSEEDHDRFARTCNDEQGKVMISGYQSEVYDEMFPAPKWQYVDFEVFASTRAVHGGVKAAVERLWANFELNEQTRLFVP